MAYSDLRTPTLAPEQGTSGYLACIRRRWLYILHGRYKRCRRLEVSWRPDRGRPRSLQFPQSERPPRSRRRPRIPAHLPRGRSQRHRHTHPPLGSHTWHKFTHPSRYAQKPHCSMPPVAQHDNRRVPPYSR